MAKEYKTKECEGECPKCGSYNVGHCDTHWYDDSRSEIMQCNECTQEFTEAYVSMYCSTEWEQDVDLNSKTLFDKY